MNKVILKGRLGKDPESKTIASTNTSVCNFTIATSDRYKDKKGDVQETTVWHNVQAWAKLGEVIQTHFSKGDEILIEGKIDNREYEKDGQKMIFPLVNMTGFEFCGSKKATATEGEAKDTNGDDDLPF